MDNTDSTQKAPQEETPQDHGHSGSQDSIQLNPAPTRPVKLQRMPQEPSKLTSRPITQPDKGRGSQLPEEVYQGIVRALINGDTIIQISHRFGISTATTEFIKARPEVKEQVPTQQSVLVNKTRNLSNLAMRRLEEALENGDVSADRLPVAVGICLTKEQEVSGNTPAPSSVHQHLHISHESVSKILESLPMGPVNSTAD